MPLAFIFEKNLTMVRESFLESPDDSFMCFRLSLFHCLSYFFFHCSPFSKDCDISGKISDSIEMFLSLPIHLQPSLCFDDFNAHHGLIILILQMLPVFKLSILTLFNLSVKE